MKRSWDKISRENNVSSLYRSGVELLQFVSSDYPFDDASQPSDKIVDEGFVAWCVRSPRRLKNIKLRTELTDNRLSWVEGNVGRGMTENGTLLHEIDVRHNFTAMDTDFLPLAAQVAVTNIGPCSVITKASVRGDGSKQLINRVTARRTLPRYPFLDGVEKIIASDAFLRALVGDIWSSTTVEAKREVERRMHNAFSSTTVVDGDSVQEILHLSQGESGALLASEELARVLNRVIRHCPDPISTLQPESVREWRVDPSDSNVPNTKRLDTLEQELRILFGDDESTLETAIGRHLQSQMFSVSGKSVISGFVSVLPKLSSREVRPIFEDIFENLPQSRLLKAALVSLRACDGKFAELGEETMKKARVFYSYSHKDEKLRDRLETSLSMLKNEELIDQWHDRRIGPGEDWEGKIDDNLRASDVVLLLISPDFVSSKYCYDIEMKLAMERHMAKEATVIPVILRTTEGWTNAPFGKLQALPVDRKPVVKWEHEDDGFAEVAKGLRSVITTRQK